MIDELKALLRNEENLDERELHYEFEQLTNRYQFEEEYSDTFEGLRVSGNFASAEIGSFSFGRNRQN